MGRGFQDFYDQFKQASRGAGAFIKLHTTGFAANNVQLLQNSMRLMGGRKGYQSDRLHQPTGCGRTGAITAMSWSRSGDRASTPALALSMIACRGCLCAARVDNLPWAAEQFDGRG